MAKLEESNVKTVKKPKAKKRKLSLERDEDEVASKSLIIENPAAKEIEAEGKLKYFD